MYPDVFECRLLAMYPDVYECRLLATHPDVYECRLLAMYPDVFECRLYMCRCVYSPLYSYSPDPLGSIFSSLKLFA